MIAMTDLASTTNQLDSDKKPHSDEAQAGMAVKSPSMSFATHFWGEHDKGFDVLLARMKQSKHTTEDIHALFKERAAIEEEYGKRLAKLARAFHPKEEMGTMREALDVVRAELERTARTHLEMANDVRLKLEKPLQEFLSAQYLVRKNYQKLMEKTLQAKSAQSSAVLKSKERYESKSLETNQFAQQIRPGLSNKDIDRLRHKMEKAQAQAVQSDLEYQTNVEKLAEIHHKWKDDMNSTCNQYQNLEMERFQYVRSCIWNMTNFLSRVCVADDESCERIRVALERCDVEKDLALFVESHSTGTMIPEPLKYTSFVDTVNSGPQRPSVINSFNGFGQSPPDGTAYTGRTSLIFGKDSSLTSINSKKSTPYLSNPMRQSQSFEFVPGLESAQGTFEQSQPQKSYQIQLQQQTLNQEQSLPRQRRESETRDEFEAPSTAAERLVKETTTNTSSSTTPLGLAVSIPESSSAPSTSPAAPVANQVIPIQAPRPVYGMGAPTAGEHSLVHKSSIISMKSAQGAIILYDPYDVNPALIKMICQVRAIYDYNAQAPEELSIRKGQIIPVIALQEDGWWEGLGTEDGRQRKGLFPSNFTEPV